MFFQRIEAGRSLADGGMGANRNEPEEVAAARKSLADEGMGNLPKPPSTCERRRGLRRHGLNDLVGASVSWSRRAQAISPEMSCGGGRVRPCALDDRYASPARVLSQYRGWRAVFCGPRLDR